MPPPIALDDDAALLREYSAERDEAAFRAMVERHLPAVWSAARRIVNGDAALAEDIAQEVFAHLAQSAAKLPPRVVLGGWLHRHTCFTAAKAVRAAARRRAREQHAAAMNATVSDPWTDLAPHLDAALNSLPAADRDAVVLRFFEKRDFRAIAAALGTSEDAARMRTARAVEKLRARLRKRSALLTAAALTSLLSEKSVAAPPSHMAAHVVETSLARAALPAVTGLASLLAKLRPIRATLIGGAALCLSGLAVWQWHTWPNGPDKSPRAPAAASSTNGKAALASVAAGKEMAFTVYFIIVPEAEAAALLADRWNSDGDTALLAALVNTAGPNPDGVHVARTLSGSCRSGQRIKLEQIKEYPWPTEFDPGENGLITPTDFAFRNVGSTAEVELETSADSDHCDVNLRAEHDFAEPVLCHTSTSLANPESPDFTAARMPEFRPAKTLTQLLLEPGQPRLAGSSQLPRLREAGASVPELRLLTFITVQPASQP